MDRIDARASAGRTHLTIPFPIGLALCLMGVLASGVSAQTVSGRVIESGGDAGIAAATVELDGARVVTDITGSFTVRANAGTHTLRVTAFGYATRETPLVVRADTTVVIALDPSPVALDPLVVEGRTMTLRGEVTEKGTDIGLYDVDVYAGSQEKRTNVVGGFKIGDLPAGPPFLLSIRAFGYKPIDTMLSLFEDTTIAFALERDSLAQRMIDHQVARLEERAAPRLTAVMPVMDRDYLMRNRNATVLDLIKFRYSGFYTRIQCIMIDDRQSYNGLEELQLYLPDEMERIEVLERGKMLRLYTRDYIRDRLGQQGKLPQPVFVQPPRGQPFCK